MNSPAQESTVSPARGEFGDSALERLLMEDDSARITLSQQLHKDVAGGLVVCTSISEMIRHELGRAAPAPDIEKIHQNLDSALRQVLGLVREITEGLFPPVLKVFGIQAALQQLARNLMPRFSGSLLLNISGDDPGGSLPHRLGIYRIVEEMIDLCVRKAEASWIEVTLQAHEPGEAGIFIDHDGRRDIWATDEGGPAMTIIQARCRMLGASFEVSTSGLGDRTRLALTMNTDR